MNQEYRLFAKLLVDEKELEPSIYDYWEKNIVSVPAMYEALLNETKTWRKDNNIEQITLDEVCWYLIENAYVSYNNFNLAYSYAVQNKRNRKKYFMQTIQKEYKQITQGLEPNPKNSFLHDDCDAYFKWVSFNSNIPKEFENPKDYIDAKYKKIQVWQRNSDAYAFQFEYFDLIKDSKRKINTFLGDLLVSCLTIINNKYFGNINAIITKSPEEFLSGIFTMSKENINDAEIKFDQTGAYYESRETITDSDDTQTVINTVTGRIEGDFSEATEEAKNELISALSQDNYLATSSLSADDFAVLVNIYSSFDADTLTKSFLEFNGRKFVQQLKGRNIRARDSRDVITSLNKLASSEINLAKYDSAGRVISISKFSFFDLSVGLLDENDQEGSMGFITAAEANQLLDDSLLASDKWKIKISPSAFLKEVFLEKKNVRIFSSSYRQLENTKLKAFALVLQNRRLVCSNMEEFLGYGFLKTQIRMTSYRPSLIAKTVSELLAELKTAGIIVRDFEIRDSGVYIKYKDFSQLEKEVYKID